MITLLSIYFALNVVLALGMHIGTLQTSLERPKPLEFAIFFLVFLFAGIPATLIAIVIGARNMNREARTERGYALSSTSRSSGIHIAHR